MIGYVLVTNQAYLKLCEVAVKGLLKFSRHRVHVDCLNCSLSITDARVTITKRDKSSVQPGDCALSKLDAIIECPFDLGVYLDADLVPNRNVDDLLDAVIRAKSPLPLLPRHVTNFPLDPRYEIFQISRTIPYGISCLIGFNHRAKQALSDEGRDWIRQTLGRVGDVNTLAGYEEVALNLWLWKCGAARQLNFCCPKSAGYLAYLRGNGSSIYPGVLTTFQVFHDEKHFAMAQAMLDDIEFYGKRDSNKPQILT